MRFMEIVVRDIDTDTMEGKLRIVGFYEISKETIVIGGNSGGEFELEKDFRKTFEYSVRRSSGDRSVRVHLGDPGEVCLRIEGNSSLFLFALSALDIETSRVKKVLPSS